jgi:hypothetical protein
MRGNLRWFFFLGLPLFVLAYLLLRPESMFAWFSKGPSVPLAVDVPCTPFEQTITMLTGFGVKPLYMILSVVIARWLRHRTERDMVLIRWSMWLFFIGEAACALSFANLGLCDLLEIGHGLGMVVMGALLPWGILEFVDRRILNTSDPQRACSLLRLCVGCWKQDNRLCPLFRVMRLTLPMLILLSCMPMTAPVRPQTIRYMVFGSVVLDEVTAVIAVSQTRLYPLFAIFFFAWTFLVLRKGPVALEKAKAPFFLGMGLFSYTVFVFLLQYSFGQQVFWANAWEELTELFTIMTIGWFLLVFRNSLGLSLPGQKKEAASSV